MTQIDTTAVDHPLPVCKTIGRSAEHYLSMFIDEIEHTLDELIEALLALEAGGGPENIKQLFIAAHRIKGSAASIGLNRVAKLAHFMEDLLQVLVDSGRMITPGIADAMLAGTDALRLYADALKAGRSEEVQFDAAVKQIRAAHAAFAPPPAPAAAREQPANPAPSASRQPAMSSADLHQQVAALSRLSEHETVLVGQITFLPALPQVGLKAQLIYEKLSNLGEVRYFDPPAADIELREELGAVRFGVATEKSADAVQRLLRIGGNPNADGRAVGRRRCPPRLKRHREQDAGSGDQAARDRARGHRASRSIDGPGRAVGDRQGAGHANRGTLEEGDGQRGVGPHPQRGHDGVGEDGGRRRRRRQRRGALRRDGRAAEHGPPTAQGFGRGAPGHRVAGPGRGRASTTCSRRCICWIG